MTRSPLHLLSAALSLALSAAMTADAQPKEPGDLWEVSSEMSMPGMPPGVAMPQRQPERVCKSRNADRPPVADTERCVMSDTQRSGSTVTWKMRCESDPPTSGSGQITYQGRDSYTGSMTMNASGQTMTIKMSGRRVGDCDAGESRRQVQARVAATQKQASDAVATHCRSAVDSMMPALLRPEYQCDAKFRAELCSKAQTPEGFASVANRQPSPIAGMPSGDLGEIGTFCGFNGNEVRLRLCKRADEQENLDFLASTCLGYARADGSGSAKPTDSFGSVIIARECAGRTFSSPPAIKYRGFCTAAARHNLMQPTTADATTGATATAKADESKDEKKDDAATRGKRFLKDLFNR